MKNYSLQSKNVLSVFRQEIRALKSRQGLTGLTPAEKERLRDLSLIVAKQESETP